MSQSTVRREPAYEDEHPVREYIGTMAGQLARMAREDGDGELAMLLEISARMAARPYPLGTPA